jgi:hypothetical protein
MEWLADLEEYLRGVYGVDDSILFDLDKVCRVCRPLWPCIKPADDFLPGPGLFPFPLCFRPL